MIIDKNIIPVSAAFESSDAMKEATKGSFDHLSIPDLSKENLERLNSKMGKALKQTIAATFANDPATLEKFTKTNSTLENAFFKIIEVGTESNDVMADMHHRRNSPTEETMVSPMMIECILALRKAIPKNVSKVTSQSQKEIFANEDFKKAEKNVKEIFTKFAVNLNKELAATSEDFKKNTSIEASIDKLFNYTLSRALGYEKFQHGIESLSDIYTGGNHNKAYANDAITSFVLSAKPNKERALMFFEDIKGVQTIDRLEVGINLPILATVNKNVQTGVFLHKANKETNLGTRRDKERFLAASDSTTGAMIPGTGVIKFSDPIRFPTTTKNIKATDSRTLNLPKEAGRDNTIEVLFDQDITFRKILVSLPMVWYNDATGKYVTEYFGPNVIYSEIEFLGSPLATFENNVMKIEGTGIVDILLPVYTDDTFTTLHATKPNVNVIEKIKISADVNMENANVEQSSYNQGDMTVHYTVTQSVAADIGKVYSVDNGTDTSKFSSFTRVIGTELFAYYLDIQNIGRVRDTISYRSVNMAKNYQHTHPFNLALNPYKNNATISKTNPFTQLADYSNEVYKAINLYRENKAEVILMNYSMTGVSSPSEYDGINFSQNSVTKYTTQLSEYYGEFDGELILDPSEIMQGTIEINEKVRHFLHSIYLKITQLEKTIYIDEQVKFKYVVYGESSYLQEILPVQAVVTPQTNLAANTDPSFIASENAQQFKVELQIGPGKTVTFMGTSANRTNHYGFLRFVAIPIGIPSLVYSERTNFSFTGIDPTSPNQFSVQTVVQDLFEIYSKFTMKIKIKDKTGAIGQVYSDVMKATHNITLTNPSSGGGVTGPVDVNVLSTVPTDVNVLSTVPTDVNVLSTVEADVNVLSTVPTDVNVLSTVATDVNLKTADPAAIVSTKETV